MFSNLKGAIKGVAAAGVLDQRENERSGSEAAEGQKGSWLSRAASKVSSAASTISTKTASLLDFHSGVPLHPHSPSPSPSLAIPLLGTASAPWSPAHPPQTVRHRYCC